ncbi:MAG: tetratricopeptide repeat protein [candidate division Zixibacteria bacterium]|nr:tetratricopeptide repeat protein [candidate division Zixibacteria bacterium]
MNVLMTKTMHSELCSGITDGHALLDLARGWLQQGNPIVAYELLKSAISSTEAERDQSLRARILKETGRVKMMQSEWESSEAYYLEAQRVFVSVEDHKGASECARNRANLHFQKGAYHKAEDLCNQALDWASTINDYELRATILNTIAAIKSATGELQEALKTFKLCLADFQSAGNAIRQGNVLLNIGLTQTEMGDYGDAVISLNQALAIALEVKDLTLVEICYQNISKCHLKLNDTILAKSVIDTARKILPGLNSKALECELNVIDAKILRMMGNLSAAEELLNKTHAMVMEHNLIALTADILLEQGIVARGQGTPEPARVKLDAAAKLFQQLGIERGFKDAVQALNDLSRRTDA